ncbi:MAG: porin [Bacteroidota bacterium]
MYLKLTRLTFIGLLLIGIFSISAKAQEKAKDEIDHSYKPLTVKLDKDGNKYIRFIMWHQLWVTTNNLSDEDANTSLEVSIRRSRFLAYAQISPKFLILTHFGLNGLTPGNLTSLGNNGNSPQMFLHDAWAELKVLDELYIGAGLHYWKGMTRLANQSTLNFMTLDQSRPFAAWHSLGITDQFARHLGIYAKGAIGKFDYRIAFNNPGRNPLGAGADFGTKASTLTYDGAATPETSSGDITGRMIIEGYFRYNLFDTESTKLPYAVGTYFGKKKVFGIGAGFFAHPNGMFDNATGEHENVLHFALDAFVDMPISLGAVNAYVAFQNFDYGENYVSRWAGTGTNVYGQLGLYFKEAKLMPYLAFQSGSYDGLDENISALDVGLNYYINGHFAKITLEYHQITNDIREGAILDTGDNNTLSQLRLQLHVFL